MASKTSDNPFQYIKSVYVFAIEFFLLNAALIFIIWLLADTADEFWPAATASFVLVSAAFYIIGKKRHFFIADIISIISGIRQDQYSSSDEIQLDKSLSELEMEIREMYMRINRDIDYLKKLEKMRTGFLANVSHELKTPIFAIGGYLETLVNGAVKDDNVNIHFLNKAIEHTENLSNLLNDLIDISMIESGEMRMSYRYFYVKDYISEIVNEFKPLAESKKLELIFHPCRDNLKLFGDKMRIKQVLNNLIQNAIKYTEEGAVEISVEEGNKWGRIIVRDSGIGISDEDLPRIFERFYRVDKDRSREVGGTGLGLAIVKHILDAHDSTVKVMSKPGEGSEFSFKLKK